MEERISRLIDEMDDTERLVFVSYYYNQMSVEEIVKIAGIEKEKVNKLLAEGSGKAVNEIGEGGIYYAALISFLAMSSEAAACRPP